MIEVRNGSCFFVKIGPNVFGITARHNIKSENEDGDLVDGFLYYKNVHKACVFMIGSTEIPDFEKLIIDDDKVLDLLTFRVPNPDSIKILTNQGNKPISPFVYTEQEWESRNLESIINEGDHIIFTGYPAETRAVFDNIISFDQKSNVHPIQRIEHYDSRASIVIDELELLSYDNNLTDVSAEIGGYSGCPVMKIGKDENPIIIGIIIEGAKADYEPRPIQISLLNNINKDGTMQKHRGFLP